MNSSRLEILAMIGFENDPFRINFKTADQTRLRAVMRMALDAGAMVSVVGDRGMGKTRAINEILNGVKVVRVMASDKGRLTISDIELAMILDLKEDETPKRSREVRARQLKRIVGEASRNHKIAVVLEEAHRIHGNTLRALKTLREIDWCGRTELFAVIMLCQSNPMAKPGVSEVRLRSDAVHMQGLTSDEAARYIRETVGEKFDADAAALIANLPDARNFLDLQQALLDCMECALAAGRTVVTKADADFVTGERREKVVPVIPSARKGNDVMRKLLQKKEAEHGASNERRVAAGA